MFGGGSLGGVEWFDLGDPLDSLAILPDAPAETAVLRSYLSFAMLLSVFPLAFELTTIGPEICAEAFLLVVNVRPNVCAAVRPGVRSLPRHLAVLECAFIPPAVCPLVDAKPLYLIIFPLAVVGATIRPTVFSLALLLASYILPFKSLSIWPLLLTLAMLVILVPLTLV